LFLPWQVADVDGDGWMDIATSFDNTAAAHNKTIYYGKRSAEGSVRYENASWPDTVGRRFGPPAQDAWQNLQPGGDKWGRKVCSGTSTRRDFSRSACAARV